MQVTLFMPLFDWLEIVHVPSTQPSEHFVIQVYNLHIKYIFSNLR